MPTLELPTLEFKMPDDSTPKNDKGEVIKTTEAVTISYSGITGSTTNDKLKNLPRYIKWISGSMTCTIQKSGGAGDLPILMKIGSLTIYADNNGIPTVLTSLQKPRSHSITIDSTTTNISSVITLSDDGSFSIQDPSWVFGQNGTTVSKSYTYSNTGLTISYENPTYTIEGLSNNPEWGEITGTGKVEITKSGDEITQTITAIPKPNCRFLCWTDGVTTLARKIVLKESELSAHNVTKTYSALFAPIALYAGTTPISEIYVGTKKPKSTAAQPESYKRGDKMPTGYIPILQIKTKDGKWLPVNAIGGQVASKVLYNNAYPTVEQALDYLFENGTGGGGSGSTGSELFIVNVQAQSEGDTYTITSHDKTYAQIDAAYKAGKQILVAFTITDVNTTYLIPLAYADETAYWFSMYSGSIFSVYVDNTDAWDCYVGAIEAYDIQAKISDDTSAESQSLQTILNYMVYPAVEKAHEHSNKSVIDGLSDANGALKYNNSFIIPQKVSEGTYITLADNTEYRLTNVTTLNLSYPTGDFECWMRLSFAASGDATVILPAGTKYIGVTPDFKNGETWELSFKDGIVAGLKVGGDGYSSAPVKGIDYWTEEDKQEIIQAVLAAMPDGTEVSY